MRDGDRRAAVHRAFGVVAFGLCRRVGQAAPAALIRGRAGGLFGRRAFVHGAARRTLAARRDVPNGALKAWKG